MKKVAILVYDNLTTFEFGCAIELFSLPRPYINGWYESDVVSFSAQQVNATGGIQISCKKIENLDGYDMLVVPGWAPMLEQPSAALIQAIKEFSNSGGRIISFCSGAFLLAACNVKCDQGATTHWRYGDAFIERFPSMKFVENVLYTYDGKTGYSAGSAAALDLGLAVIREDYSHDIANQVARHLVISPHRQGGQSQFVEAPMPSAKNRLSSTLDWAIERLNQPLAVNDMAEHALMSRRSFDRQFRQSLNMSPKDWLIQQRLNVAKKLLEENAHSIERIAEYSGFGTGMTLRHHFQRQLGIAPTTYQQQFCRM